MTVDFSNDSYYSFFGFLGSTMKSGLPNDTGTKQTIFCNLIDMALQKKMPWAMLANTLDCIIPSFEESKQVIKILLKELENLQLKLIEKETEEVSEPSKVVTSI